MAQRLMREAKKHKEREMVGFLPMNKRKSERNKGQEK
jgi:hypothetical protein